VRSFVDTWPTLSVEVRRDVAGALLTSVRVFQDKTVEILRGLTLDLGHVRGGCAACGSVVA
jgi:hypothetical protein